MSEEFEELIGQVLALGEEERGELALRILQSLGADPDVLDTARDDVESGMPWSEARHELLAEIG